MIGDLHSLYVLYDLPRYYSIDISHITSSNIKLVGIFFIFFSCLMEVVDYEITDEQDMLMLPVILLFLNLLLLYILFEFNTLEFNTLCFLMFISFYKIYYYKYTEEEVYYSLGLYTFFYGLIIYIVIYFYLIGL